MPGNKNSTFFDTFVGEFVHLVTKLPMQIDSSNEDSRTIQSDLFRLEGYLLDIDEKYYYLGETNQEVGIAVSISEVLSISIAKTELDGILDIIETPEDPEGFN